MDINIAIRNGMWVYFYYDKEGYKHMTEGFETRPDAEDHARAHVKERFDSEVTFFYE